MIQRSDWSPKPIREGQHLYGLPKLLKGHAMDIQLSLQARGMRVVLGDEARIRRELH